MPFTTKPTTTLCPLCNAPMRLDRGRLRCSVGGHRRAGRRPQGAKALTSAEKQRAYRERQRAAGRQP